MGLFDRHAKLRDVLRVGRLHTSTKEMLPLLRGQLTKADLPGLIVEPAGTGELAGVLRYAADKGMKVAVASGLKPVDVRGLDGNMLLLTTRLTGSPVFSSAHRTVRVNAGMAVEALSVDLSRAEQCWLPLLPVPANSSLGELIAGGWDGLRNWRDGDLRSHVRVVDWMGYDGRDYRTGPATIGDAAPDVSVYLHGSRAALGIITAVELELTPVPARRSATLLEVQSAADAVRKLAELRQVLPPPETVIYWGMEATRILRDGNDNRVSDSAQVLLAIEWRESLSELPDCLTEYGTLIADAGPLAALWQDLFRFPRTAARLYPGRTSARLTLPADALPELETAAAELGREFNLCVALWGTVEFGQFHVWILQPDDQPRTAREAEELLRKIVEIAAELGGFPAPGCRLPFEVGSSATGRGLGDAVYRHLLNRCDPAAMHIPLN